VTTHFDCAYCGETNDLFVDPSEGDRQSYVEDCQVCCRPNLLTIRGNALRDEFRVEAIPENE
jgi:hypothetical protein